MSPMATVHARIDPDSRRHAPIARIGAAVIAGVLAVISTVSHAMDDTELGARVSQRLSGDRTGACMAVAVIGPDRISRAYSCANAADRGRIGADSAFEIGSVSKTMTAALLAGLIQQGKGTLDDPLSAWLPAGTPVPQYQGQPILLRHVLTHTSGLPALPSRLGAANPDDPYARLDEAALLASLGDVVLDAPPGSRFVYSNFASMLLSDAVARRAGVELDVLLRERLFQPLGMAHAHLGAPPAGIRAAIGHTPNGKAAPAWQFATNLAGVGGVRATLDDMVRYVQGQLGQVNSPVTAALRLSQTRLLAQPPMAMNWMLARLGDRVIHLHEGGTGGFSAWLAFDVTRNQGVVVLSDTSWTTLGGLSNLGMHLLDASRPLDAPRRDIPADPALLDALAGEYQLPGGLRMTVRRHGDALEVQAAGQAAHRLGHDSAGDFYPRDFDAILRPWKTASGQTFIWMQGGGQLPATRLGP